VAGRWGVAGVCAERDAAARSIVTVRRRVRMVLP
jgi:hypothetical protein